MNNGVYACGFATNQAAYDRAFDTLFTALDTLEARLATRRYLLGDRITEPDWRLFVTLVRFDAVYVGHFKCNRQRIADYPALSNYLRDLYQIPGIATTVSLAQIKAHLLPQPPEPESERRGAEGAAARLRRDARPRPPVGERGRIELTARRTPDRVGRARAPMPT